MEELLKIAYREFLNEKDERNSESVKLINSQWKKIDKAMDIIRETLSDKLNDELYDLIVDGSGDVQEAAFIAGFSYCAKFLTNGKVEFLS